MLLSTTTAKMCTAFSSELLHEFQLEIISFSNYRLQLLW